jgi:hypothetical protein
LLYRAQQTEAERKRKQDQADAIALLREKMKIEQEDPYKMAMADMIRGMGQGGTQPGAGGQIGSQPGMRPKVSFSSTGPSISFEESPEEKLRQATEVKRMQELLAGPDAADKGKVVLARESLKNIDDIRNILFSDGTAKSFDRGAAFQGNMPGGQLPMLPSFLPTQKGQDLNRKLGASLSGRQLIQTGVAARPEETQKLVGQFAPNVFSNPESSLKGLEELKAFYNDFLKTADPALRLGGSVLGQNAPTQQGGMVKVTAPDGTTGSIPQEDLQEALQSGYQLIGR